MNRWLARLAEKKAAHPPLGVLSELPKAPSVSFVSTSGGGCRAFRGRIDQSEGPAANLSDVEIEAFEERAGILEFDAGLPRAEAERIAACITRPAAPADDDDLGRKFAERRSCAADAQVERTVASAQDRPYRLTPPEGDAAHADAWDDAAIGRFQARVGRLASLGFSTDDCDDLAERLHLLDIQAENRHLCVDCNHLVGHKSAGWRRRSPRAAQAPADLPIELVSRAQRCAAWISTP